jgi:hypothetical protein
MSSGKAGSHLSSLPVFWNERLDGGFAAPKIVLKSVVTPQSRKNHVAFSALSGETDSASTLSEQRPQPASVGAERKQIRHGDKIQLTTQR